MFFKGSRYSNVDEETVKDKDDREVRYKKIRFIPATEAYMVHSVNQGERPDHIAFKYYRDPERFWRICDANLVMWPNDLVSEPGRRILIPPSEG
jgi:hypothetical protein